MSPSCTSAGGILLCDGGVVSCLADQTCDFGACFPKCASGCSDGGICDLAAEACIAGAACSANSECPTADSCLSGVCVTAPTGPASGTDCADAGPVRPDDAGEAISGAVGVILNTVESTTPPLDGGTVTFLFPDGGMTTSPIQYSNGSTRYSVPLLPIGELTAVVSGPGLVQTYFPGLQILPNTSELDLDTVVSVSYLASLAAATGVSALKNQPVWVGEAITCGTSAATPIGGYTVGLSPAPVFLGYYEDVQGAPLSTSPLPASTSLGEFVGFGAAYAATSYVMAAPDGVLLYGSFTPPALGSSPIAVALIYPNFSQ